VSTNTHPSFLPFRDDSNEQANPQGSGLHTWAGKIRAAFRKILNRNPLLRPSKVAHDTLLLDAAVAIRNNRLDDASAILDPYYRFLVGDAAYLNLLGVIAERRKEFATAMELYKIAINVDSTFLPARHNLRGIAEARIAYWKPRNAALGDREIRARRTLNAEPTEITVP
jgi:tetratricopeptide (TPR) repeat protein